MLRHSPFNGSEPLEDVLGWCASYRGARDSDLSVEEAAANATAEYMTEVPFDKANTAAEYDIKAPFDDAFAGE
jgi:hypothetical protein